MKKYLLAFGALLTSATLVGCSATPEPVAAPLSTNAETVRIGSIDWYVNYDDALADAKQTNRPVWLHFGENPG